MSWAFVDVGIAEDDNIITLMRFGLRRLTVPSFGIYPTAGGRQSPLQYPFRASSADRVLLSTGKQWLLLWAAANRAVLQRDLQICHNQCNGFFLQGRTHAPGVLDIGRLAHSIVPPNGISHFPRALFTSQYPLLR